MEGYAVAPDLRGGGFGRDAVIVAVVGRAGRRGQAHEPRRRDADRGDRHPRRRGIPSTSFLSRPPPGASPRVVLALGRHSRVPRWDGPRSAGPAPRVAVLDPAPRP